MNVRTTSFSYNLKTENERTNSLLPSSITSAVEKVQNWLECYGKDFVTHATSKKNFSLIVKKGALVPAEALLRETGNVEYEMGATGARGDLSIPQLTETAVQHLKFLNSVEQNELDSLNQLFKEQTLSVDECQELKSLRKKILEKGKEKFTAHFKHIFDFYHYCFQQWKLETDKDYQAKLHEYLLLEGINSLSSEDTARYQKLSSQWTMTASQEKRRRFLERKRQGISCIFINEDPLNPTNLTPVNDPHFERTKELHWDAVRYKISDKVMEIIFDQIQGKPLDKYLSKKYKKWLALGMTEKKANEILNIARSFIITPSKLNFDIRVLKDKTAWGYGKIVLYKGNVKTVSRGDNSGKYDTSGVEHFLLAPWQNGGEFFHLPLVGDDTLILGPEKELSSFSNQLSNIGAQFAYFEDLTQEQRDFFHVPQ